MSDPSRTRPEHIKEISALKKKIQELEQAEIGHKAENEELRHNIVELQRVEAVLRDSEGHYRTLAEMTNDMIFIINRDDCIEYVNNVGAGQFGYSPEEIVGMPRTQLFPPETATEQKISLQRVFQGGSPLHVEGRTSFPGRDMWHSTWLIPLKDNAGIVKSVLGVARDITARKLAEESLRESKEQFRTLAEKAPDGIFVQTSGQFAYVNVVATKMFGAVSSDQLLGLPVMTRFHPDYHAAIRERIRLVNEERTEVALMEQKYLKLDGTPFDVEVSAVPFLYENQKGALVFFHDITTRKQIENAFLAEKKFSESILNTMPGIFCCFDDRLQLKRWNRNLERTSGYSAQEISKMSPFDFFSGNVRQLIEEQLEKVFKEGESSIETDFVSKDGCKTPYFLTGLKVMIDDVKHLIGVGIDISSRKQAEEALEQSRQNFYTFFNTINDFLYVLDESGSIMHVNNTVVRRLGYTKAELVGQSVLIVHPPERKEEATQIIAAILDGKTSSCFIPVMTKDGRLIAVETSVTKGIWNGKPALFGVSKDISQLKQSEEKFSRAFHSNSVSMALSTIEGGRFLDVNETFLTTMGFSREEVIGKTSIELGVFVDPENRVETHLLIKETGRVHDVEIQVLTKDGRILDGLFSADTVTINDVPCLLTVMTDITERKQAQEVLKKHKKHLEELIEERTKELRIINEQLQLEITIHKNLEQTLEESRDKERQLIETLQEGIWEIDKNTYTTFVNPRMAEMLGYSVEEMLGKNIFLFIDEQDIEIAKQKLENCEKSTIKQFEFKFFKKDGSRISALLLATPFIDNEGNFIGGIAGVIDITEQKNSENILQESEMRFRQLAENIQEVFWISAPDISTMIYISPAFETVWGVPREKVYENPLLWIDSIHPEDRQKVFAAIETHAQGKYTVEYRIVRPDGEIRWIWDRGFPMLDKNGVIKNMCGVAEDITQRKEVELTIRQAQEDLEFKVAKRTEELAHYAAELEERNKEINALSQMTDLLQACKTLDEAYAVIAGSVSELFTGFSGALYMNNPSQNLLYGSVFFGVNPPEEKQFSPEDCWSLRRGKINLVEDPHAVLQCRHVNALKDVSYLCIPMVIYGEPLGVFHIRGFSLESKLQLFENVTDRIGMSLANIKLHEILRGLSIRDHLTGLYNRRYMEESIERELTRAERKGMKVGIIMLDIDYFKNYNDSFGHEVGDSLLKALGSFLQQNVRSSDIACRYGGEEFIIILPDSSLEISHQRAEYLREAVKNLQIHHSKLPRETVTVSFGVAVFPDHGFSAESVINAADIALYRAKEEGRDRVSVATLLGREVDSNN